MYHEQTCANTCGAQAKSTSSFLAGSLLFVSSLLQLTEKPSHMCMNAACKVQALSHLPENICLWPPLRLRVNSSSRLRSSGLGIPGVLSGREEDIGSRWDSPVDRCGLWALIGQRKVRVEFSKLKRGQQTFLKGQIVNILGFSGHIWLLLCILCCFLRLKIF